MSTPGEPALAAILAGAAQDDLVRVDTHAEAL
jgi:hypothetical protein